MEHQEVSLDAAVREVRRLAESLESGTVGDEGSAERQAQIQRTLGLCSACEDAVARGGLFSPNEELDDIPTHSLLLLLLPYYSAILTLHIRTRPNPVCFFPLSFFCVLLFITLHHHQQIKTGDVQQIVERTAVLADVRHTLRAFVQRMRDLGVLAKEDCEVTLAALDADAAALADDGEHAAAAPARVDPAAARTEKISAYRRKKVMRALLDQIAQRRADSRKHRGIVSAAQEEEEERKKRTAAVAGAATGAATRVYLDEEDEEDEDEDEDEETGRQLRVTALKYAALVALDELGGVVREEAMLTEIARLKARGTFEAVRAREAQELAQRQASARRPFTVTRDMLDARERYARDVFKPFNPATLMPDDPAALAADDALSGLREERRRAAAGLPDPDAARTSEDDDSDRETEESLRKAREWDEFKDNNPRGWGNTIGMG